MRQIESKSLSVVFVHTWVRPINSISISFVYDATKNHNHKIWAENRFWMQIELSELEKKGIEIYSRGYGLIQKHTSIMNMDLELGGANLIELGH